MPTYCDLRIPCPLWSVLFVSVVLSACHPATLPGSPLPASGTSGARGAADPGLREAVPQGPDLPAQSFQLKNGLSVVLKENHVARVVALQAWVAAGAADEPEDQTGIAHIFEHLLFAVTTHRPPGRISREVEAAGGQLSAWTTLDQTVFQLVLASRFLDTGLDLLADALQNASFPQQEVTRDILAITDEIAQAEGSPERLGTQALFSAAYRRHPYRRPVVGTMARVKALTRAQILSFYQQHYVAGKVTLVLCGDFDAGAARRMIETALSGMRRGPEAGSSTASSRPMEPVQKELRVVAAEYDLREAQLLLGFHVPQARSPDTGALDLAAAILGGGEGARLQVEARHNRQVVSEVHAYSYTPRDPGLLVVGAQVPPPLLGEAAFALLSEVFRLAREEVSPAELLRAQAALSSDSIYQRETVEGAARRLGFFSTTCGGLGYEAEYLRQIREMTPARLREVLARYLVPENLTMALLQPRAGGLAAALGPRRGGRARVLLEAVVATDKGRAERLLRAVVAQVEEQAKQHPSVPALFAGTKGPAVAPGGVIEHRLQSGGKLLILPDHGVPLLAMRAVWPGGLRYEDERSSGAGQLLSRLLLRETHTRSAEQLRRELAAISGSLSGQTGPSSFGIGVQVPSQHFEQGLMLLFDCLRNPSFNDEAVENQRRRLLEELRTQEDSEAQMAFHLFLRAMYPRHPYRLDLHGSPQSVALLSRRRLQEFYRRNYPLSRMTLAVVGDIDPARLIERAEALLSPGSAAAEGPPPDPAPAPPVDPPPPEPVQVFKYGSKQQAHLLIGFRGTTLFDPDHYALEVLQTLLLSPGRADLRADLRDRRGLTYRVDAFSLMGVDPGYLAVYVATSPEKLETAQAGIRDDLRRLLDHPVGDEELLGAKRHMVGVHEIGLQRRWALAQALAQMEAQGMGFMEYQRYADQIMKVSAADVQRVARKYLDEGHAVTVAVLPESLTPAAVRRNLREVLPARSSPPPPPPKTVGKKKKGRR